MDGPVESTILVLLDHYCYCYKLKFLSIIPFLVLHRYCIVYLQLLPVFRRDGGDVITATPRDLWKLTGSRPLTLSWQVNALPAEG